VCTNSQPYWTDAVALGRTEYPIIHSIASNPSIGNGASFALYFAFFFLKKIVLKFS
jgi:hypothetical protein